MTVLVLLLGEAELILAVLPRHSTTTTTTITTTISWLGDVSFSSLSLLLIISSSGLVFATFGLIVRTVTSWLSAYL